MQTVPYTDIEYGVHSDIGKICLMIGSLTLAIEDTLEDCIHASENCTGDAIARDGIDDHTDLHYLTTDDLVAVIIGPVVD